MNSLINAVFVLGMVGVIGGIMLTVMTGLGLTGDAALFIGNATAGMTNLGAQLGLVGTVAALGAVLVIVMAAFGAYVGWGQRR